MRKEKHSTIAVIDPFPGDMSAEHEVVLRLLRTAADMGISMVACDTFGRILDEDLCVTDDFVDESSLRFAISTHYETHKALDTFYYHTLWNPPEIPLNLSDYPGRVSDNYIMNDDFLIFDSGGMTNHLRGILMRKPRTLEGASVMTPSFPASAVMEPRLDEPVMFYCGMNWEKVTSHTNRHEGLFKLLDQTGKVKFFGPDKVKAWGGIRPWAGYRCYQYSIPFDGFSIIKEINKCGVCLVLSSDAHRRAGAATTRLYEACAAGAVIISDENEFVMRRFRDAALFIRYNKKKPEDTFRQIMEKYQWIVSHPHKAQKMAEKAQKIFLEQFSLDIQMTGILKNHEGRKKQIADDLYAKDPTKKVLVTYVLDTLDIEKGKRRLKCSFQNMKQQIYLNIELVVAADVRISEEMDDFCRKRCRQAKVHAMRLFDGNGCRVMTDGRAIRAIQKAVKHDYYMNTSSTEKWFCDHVTTLVRAMDDADAMCAYSGSLAQDEEGIRHTHVFERIGREYLYDQINNSYWFPAPGQFLFSAEADKHLPDFLFDCVDGKEHYLYANMLRYIGQERLAFSDRMTIVFEWKRLEKKAKVVDDARQSRFIQGLVCHAISDMEGGSGSGGINGNVLATFPIKLWFRVRVWKAIMCRARIDWLYHTSAGHYQKLKQRMVEIMR